MKLTKIMAMIAAAILVSSQALAAGMGKDLSDTYKSGVMDSFNSCVETMGGANACASCVVFDGNRIVSHDHDCIAAGGLKASDYSGAKAAAVRSLLKRHQYLMR